MTVAEVKVGHNKPPIVLPKDDEMLEDLQKRFPEIDARLKEWDGAFAEFPTDITLDMEDVAQNLQDLLSQVKKESKVWTDSYQKNEKSPLNKLVKVVGNFFTGRAEKAQTFLEKWGPVHETFLQRKAKAATEKAEAEAAAQRETERLAREAAQRAAEEQRQAEERAAEQRRIETEERERAEQAKRDREAAEERARLAKEEEKRQIEEKRQKDTAEKEVNNSNLREIRGHMREAEKLHTLVLADEASDDEEKRLDELVKAGGVISTLATPVAASLLLTDEQTAGLATLKEALSTMRGSIAARSNKRETARREKERLAEEKRQADLAERRRLEREAEDKRLAEAKANREAEERKAEEAKAERERAEKAAREARDSAKDATSEAKDAGRAAKNQTSEADRAGNRATRVENRLDNSTEADLSRTRGDLGSVGGLARKWYHYITDEDALRAALRRSLKTTKEADAYGVLIDQLNSEALNGAVYRWMRLHQGGWDGRERVDDALEGCVFAYETEARIA